MLVATPTAFLAVACVPADPPGNKAGPAASASAKAVFEPATVQEPVSPASHAKPAPAQEPVSPRAEPAHGSTASDPLVTAPFRDSFERAALGPDYRPTSAAWQIDAGRLCVQGARNHGVWLTRRIPINARIEFDATTRSEDGDIKAEFWGDGSGAATGAAYTNATSYLTIFGGWKNSFHVLARLNEHGHDRRELHVDPDERDFRAMPVRPNVSYHFKVERTDGRTVHWYVDDLEIHAFEDSSPLAGSGHDHFGFNDWDVSLCFDNLVVTPLG